MHQSLSTIYTRNLCLFPCAGATHRDKSSNTQFDISGRLWQAQAMFTNYDKGHFVGPPNFVLDIESGMRGETSETHRTLMVTNKVIEYVIIKDGQQIEMEWNRLVENRYVRV